MDIYTLCEIIDLQPEIKSCVLDFSKDFDFTTVDKQLICFQNYEKMSEALSELQAILGEDTDNIKILSCMLKASAEVYFDTMKCYPRFISETYQMTGKLYFDRYWWTTRQAGCHLFRIGELEYEMKHIDDEIVIDIHIPSDADFSPSAIDESLSSAKRFFSEHYPELSNAEYRCHSWLLDKQLRKMLKGSSNILNFQNRFEIFDEGEIDTEFIEWLYNTRTKDYDTLPEKT